MLSFDFNLIQQSALNCTYDTTALSIRNHIELKELSVYSDFYFILLFKTFLYLAVNCDKMWSHQELSRWWSHHPRPLQSQDSDVQDLILVRVRWASIWLTVLKWKSTALFYLGHSTIFQDSYSPIGQQTWESLSRKVKSRTLNNIVSKYIRIDLNNPEGNNYARN